MSKTPYIVLLEQDDRLATTVGLTTRVIGNAMRLLIATILMSALVVIIILAAQKTASINQQVQPWTFAPAPVPLPSEAQQNRIIKRQYILCNSELISNSSKSNLVDISKFDRKAIQAATDVFKNCVVVEVNLDVEETEHPNELPSSSDRNESLLCAKMASLPENPPTTSGTIQLGDLCVPIYDLDAEQVFHGTPFLSKWQDLLNSEEDMLDRVIRLLLVWHFGGISWDIDAACSNETALRYFKEVMEYMHDKVIAEKENAIVVYSNVSCHSVIGTMLLDFAEVLIRHHIVRHEHLRAILDHAQAIYPTSIYLLPSSDIWREQKRSGLFFTENSQMFTF